MRQDALSAITNVSSFEVATQERTINTAYGATKIYIHTPAATIAGASLKPPLIVNMHGGGFKQPYMERDNIFCRFLAKTSGCVIFDIDYCLAPEHPFPEGLNESYQAARYAYLHADELNANGSKLILLGHSSGGNFAAVIARRAANTGDFPVALQILDYPPMDLFTDPASKFRPYSLPVELMREFDDAYVPNIAMRKNPDVSPLYTPETELEGAPRALIIACGLDCLANEALDYGDKLRRAGVSVESVLIEKALHGATVNFRHGWSKAVNAMLAAIGELSGREYPVFTEESARREEQACHEESACREGHVCREEQACREEPACHEEQARREEHVCREGQAHHEGQSRREERL